MKPCFAKPINKVNSVDIIPENLSAFDTRQIMWCMAPTASILASSGMITAAYGIDDTKRKDKLHHRLKALAWDFILLSVIWLRL